MTGLQFKDDIYEANPLLHNGSEGINEHMNGPEHFEVARPSDILSSSTQRQTINDDIVDIFISAAMVNPKGTDHGNEWISLLNLGNTTVDINGWKLVDNSNKTRVIDNIVLAPGESAVINNVLPLQLGNNGDVIKLFDVNGARIDWVNYSKRMVRNGKPVVFLSPRDTLD